MLLKPCLLILPDLTDHLLVEVLHEVEVLVDDVQVRVALKGGALEVGIHVAGNRAKPDVQMRDGTQSQSAKRAGGASIQHFAGGPPIQS